MSFLKRLINKIGRVGIPETDSFAIKRRKEFFNILTVVAAFASIPQAIIGFSFSTTYARNGDGY
jgi:hypothetical protein